MSEEKNFAEDLARELRKKKIRKYALAALAVVILISTAVGLNIENKDSLLPDGQGNIDARHRGYYRVRSFGRASRRASSDLGSAGGLSRCNPFGIGTEASAPYYKVGGESPAETACGFCKEMLT